MFSLFLRVNNSSKIAMRFLRTVSLIDLISRKIQIVGGNLLKNLGLKSQFGKVKYFLSYFLFIFIFSIKNWILTHKIFLYIFFYQVNIIKIAIFSKFYFISIYLLIYKEGNLCFNIHFFCGENEKGNKKKILNKTSSAQDLNFVGRLYQSSSLLILPT